MALCPLTAELPGESPEHSACLWGTGPPANPPSSCLEKSSSEGLAENPADGPSTGPQLQPSPQQSRPSREVAKGLRGGCQEFAAGVHLQLLPEAQKQMEASAYSYSSQLLVAFSPLPKETKSQYFLLKSHLQVFIRSRRPSCLEETKPSMVTTKGGPGPGQDEYLSRHRKGAQGKANAFMF